MPSTSCPFCGKRLKFPESLAGKKIRCPGCKEPFQLALEEERVRIEELSIADFDRLPQIINEFAEEIEEMGMNPFKGF